MWAGGAGPGGVRVELEAEKEGFGKSTWPRGRGVPRGWLSFPSLRFFLLEVTDLVFSSEL